MESLKVGPETTNEEREEPWKPYQRPGVLGVDYDDYGAEMSPNARVWKRYVEESDRMDKELVEGWNGMLDIILIFAALFSAISTAFVIESSKDLKPDYTQKSAQTLLAISQALSAISKGVPINESADAMQELPNVTPSYSAVVVNSLWFLSLSLSVAVSLVAILAKDWCSSFMAGRVGSMLRQGRLRQQRWNGVQLWKMKEILYVLPLLLHIALLLFAVGLSMYLWDINIAVALPVVVTTSLAATFYLITALLPLFFRFCPYTTPLVRFIYPYWISGLTHHYTTDCIGAMVASIAWSLHKLALLKRRIIFHQTQATDLDSGSGDIEATVDQQLDITPISFHDKMNKVSNSVYHWGIAMQGMFSTDRLQLTEEKTPMDDLTCSMLSWMIINCEDPRSVDMALQALAGAELWLPRRRLWECGVVGVLYNRISSVTTSLIYSNEGEASLDQLLDEASLFSRSLGFVTAFLKGEGLDLREEDNPRFALDTTAGPEINLTGDAYSADAYFGFQATLILTCSWNRPSPRYEVAAYELNAIPAEANENLWEPDVRTRDQCSRQWELVRLVTTGKVSSLPLRPLLALLSGITKTYFFEPSQSPIPLIHLLNSRIGSIYDPNHELQYSVGVSLAVSAIASGCYPWRGKDVRDNSQTDTPLQWAKQTYDELVTKETGQVDAHQLLTFGLLTLLTQRNEHGWTLSEADVKAIGQCFEHLYLHIGPTPYHDMISIIPPSFGQGQHLMQIVSECLVTLPHELSYDSSANSPALSRLDVALSHTLCLTFGESIFVTLTQSFMGSKSTELKKILLRGIYSAMSQWNSWRDKIFEHLLQSGFLELLVNTVTSPEENLTPQIMHFLWDAGSVSTSIISQTEQADRPIFISVAQSLSNKFTVRAEGGFPVTVGDLGFIEMWFPTIAKICQDNPQSILESQLLSELVQFYGDKEHSHITPRTTEIDSPFDNQWTWSRILQELDKNCKNAVKKSSEPSFGHGVEHGYGECQGSGQGGNKAV